MRVIHGTALAVLTCTSAAWSATIDVGNIPLLPDTPGQVVRIWVTGGEQVTGFNLMAQIGDGTGPGVEPVFQAIAFTGGTIWDAGPVTITGGPFPGFEQDAQASVVFNAAGTHIPASGLLLELQISTVGIISGSYPLLLKESEIGAPSTFILPGTSEEVVPAISNGLITVTPEPGVVMVGLAGAGILLAQRRRNRSI